MERDKGKREQSWGRFAWELKRWWWHDPCRGLMCLDKVIGLVFLIVLTFGAAGYARVLSEHLKVYGDLRFRLERDYDSVKADGITKRDNRDRFRTRMRLGLKYEPYDFALFNVRARAADNNSQQSPHITLMQDKGDKGDRSDITFDRVFLKLTFKEFWFALGRVDLPFWKPNELLWDDDVYQDGFSMGVSRRFDHAKISLQGGTWKLPDGTDSHSFSRRSLLSAVQLVFTPSLGNGQFTLAGGALFINDKDSVKNTTNDDVDYTINVVNLQYRFTVAEKPFTLGADYLHNFEKGPQADPFRNDRDGFVIYGQLGEISDSGDFLVAYYYVAIEKYALARFFAQDDWFRFGSATQTRSSDFRGHEIRLGYAFSAKINLLLRAYFVDTISTKENGNRLRLDLNIKF